MGMIRVEISGSFTEDGNVEFSQFSAVPYGHAHAVTNALNYLTEILRRSINEDHALHEDGQKPEKGFEREFRRTI